MKKTLRPAVKSLAWYRSLSKRDFDNGATLDEIDHALKEREELLALLKEALPCVENFQADLMMPDSGLRPVIERIKAGIAKAERIRQ